jgi:hypothetical protein
LRREDHSVWKLEFFYLGLSPVNQERRNDSTHQKLRYLDCQYKEFGKFCHISLFLNTTLIRK